MNIIETKNLTKYYGKTLGIKDLNLNLEEGEILGFIGPNGAGKSTTIRLLLSLIYPTSGSATIFGKDVIKFGPEIKQDIGYLPSEVYYYDKMRVRELLNYSASFYQKDCTKRINELAELLKLDLNKRIDDLSFGNKKKVGIIQGLLHSPKLIVLDEPTGGLDPLIQSNFFELLRQENQSGVSILFSSHILGEVQKLCKRVAIIKEGELIKVDTLSDLESNNYKRFNITTKGTVDKKLFDIKDITDLVLQDHNISFLYKGDVNNITHIIAKLKLVDLTVNEPDLEEVFMHYYR